MSNHNSFDETRRRLLKAMLAAPLVFSTPALLNLVASTTVAAGTLEPTLSCDDGDDDPTPAQTEGPYFTRNSPHRSSLVGADAQGTPLVVTGLVLTRSCKPIANALLDFWQTDAAGNYDNAGFRFRGHQFTDERGSFALETVVPGLYPGRTRHIHVKVQAPGRSVLTTQLYFPGEGRNASDRIFHPSLQMRMEDAAGRRTGLFNFVLDIA
jgi:protocatechuate 3,4-dioxygenase beta subunit